MKKLPLESRTMAMAAGGLEYWGWNPDRHLRASLIDAINANTHTFVMANTPKNKAKPKPPRPVPRPGDAERKREQQQNNPFALMVKKQMENLRKREQESPKKIIITEDSAKEA